MIKKAVMTHLLENLTTNRLHFVGAPPKTETPYGVVSVVSANRTLNHDGKGNLIAARMQIDWFGTSDTEVEGLFEETQTAMDDFHGVQEEVVVYLCELDDEMDMHESDTGLFHKSFDYIIHYERGN